MSLRKVRAALEKRLGTLSPAIATAYENLGFAPTSGTPYQKTFLMRGAPDNTIMGDKVFEEVGIFQVSLMYPQNVGAGDAEARAELIRTHFKRGQTLNEDGIRVHITRTPTIPQGRPDGDRWHIPVTIRWHAYIAT